MSMSRRNTELGLLLFAAIPVAILFILVGMRAGDAFSWQHLAVPAALFGLFIAAHVAIRYYAPNADSAMLPIVFVLSAIGIAFVTRLVPDRAIMQIAWLFLSVIALVVVLALVPSLERLGNYKYIMMVVGLALLLAPAVIGKEINGSKLWIVIGGFSIQPGEIARIFIILFLAAYLAENRELLSISTRRFLGMPLPELRALGPLVLMWGVSFLIMIAEKDLGSSLLFYCIFLVMVYVATGRLSYIVVGLGLFTGGAAIAYKLFSHVQLRVEIWLDPFKDAANKSYQLVQSMFAFADGGILGKGIGQGVPTRIPYVDTDFIFAAIGEELGLLGAGAILLLFLTLIYRSFSVAARAKSDMAGFSAVGFGTSIAFQVFVIVGGVIGLIPLTGITVPFISRGGSSIFASFVLLALLLRAGDETTGVTTEMQTLTHSGHSLGRLALTKRLTVTTIIVGLMFGALLVQLTNLQVVSANKLRNHSANSRPMLKARYIDRGAIVSADGVTLAESKIQEDGTFKRNYPQGRFASHVVGYYSEKHGRTGIEAAANDALSGTERIATFKAWLNQQTGQPTRGDNVALTLNAQVQQAAEAALASSHSGKGAIVVIDPRSGAVLASASRPNYDPGTIDEEWEAISNSDDGILIDRTRQSLTAPGSTFKIVTLTSALENGIGELSTTYPAPGSTRIGNAPVTNFAGTTYPDSSLEAATIKSINTVFAQLAVDLGPDKLVEGSERFGFNEEIPFDLNVKSSLMPLPGEMTTWETAWAGVGQPVGEHESPAGPQSTVMQMALVASGIANEGKIMRPYIIDTIKPLSEFAVPLSGTSRRVWKTACTPDTAKKVSEAMVKVVEEGTGRGARIPGVKVAGKTGTAEVGKNKVPNAWFIAFAPADNPSVAIAVMLEGAGQGGRLAAPAAKTVLEKALEVQENSKP